MAIEIVKAPLTLAPTLGPLVRQNRAVSGSFKRTLGQLHEAGFQWVQLDATLSGLRPRELSPRSRKDLLALCARLSLSISGIDLFIPRKHWLDSATLDRAVAAALGAIELAADLGRVHLSMSLPVHGLGADVRDTLVTAADARGVGLAIHAEDQLEALQAWVDQVDRSAMGLGLDPAALLTQGQIPDAVVHQQAKRLAVGRLSDLSESGSGLRCPVGQGELDLLRYRIALDLSQRRRGPVVLDLRGLENPAEAMLLGQRAWEHHVL